MTKIELGKYNELQDKEIKSIVNSNVDITDEELYNKMYDWNKSIYWYREENGTTRKDGTVYYPRVSPIGSRKDYKEWSIELQQIASKYRTFDKQFKSFVDNWNPNPYKFAKAVSKLFFNINNNEEALENVRKHFANIQYNIRK